MGFVPPLPSGTYTFWAQQLNGPTTYQLDFVVAPEPVPSIGPLGLVALMSLIGGIGLRGAWFGVGASGARRPRRSPS